MTLSPGNDPEPHWWKASALTLPHKAKKKTGSCQGILHVGILVCMFLSLLCLLSPFSVLYIYCNLFHVNWLPCSLALKLFYM